MPPVRKSARASLRRQDRTQARAVGRASQQVRSDERNLTILGNRLRNSAKFASIQLGLLLYELIPIAEIDAQFALTCRQPMRPARPADSAQPRAPVSNMIASTFGPRRPKRIQVPLRCWSFSGLTITNEPRAGAPRRIQTIGASAPFVG